jgi:hypothetical protein
MTATSLGRQELLSKPQQWSFNWAETVSVSSFNVQQIGTSTTDFGSRINIVFRIN